MKIQCFLIFGLFGSILARPEGHSLVVRSVDTTSEERNKVLNKVPPKPVIQKFHVRTDIQYRYARTVVESRMLNPSIEQAQVWNSHYIFLIWILSNLDPSFKMISFCFVPSSIYLVLVFDPLKGFLAYAVS